MNVRVCKLKNRPEGYDHELMCLKPETHNIRISFAGGISLTFSTLNHIKSIIQMTMKGDGLILGVE